MRKTLLLFALLIAAAIPATGQQFIAPVGGTITVPISAGTGNSFTSVLTGNISSFSFNGQPFTPGQIVSFIFVQNATGGFTVSYAANIVNGCSPTSSASAVTVCLYEFDQLSNTWYGVGGTGGGGGGGVSSVGLALPASLFTISGSPVTGSGTLTGAFITNATPVTVFGNCTSSAATPSFCSIVNSMLPASGASAGSYTNSNVTVNAQGIVTSISNGSGGTSGTVTNIATSSPISGGPITATGTLSCPTCGVTGSPLSQFAATTSAQLAGVITDETGTGAAVFAISPTLVTPALGTPSALVLTNATGLPAASVLSGALVNGMTATTQTVGDNTTKVATDAFVIANAGSGGSSAFAAITPSTNTSSGFISAPTSTTVIPWIWGCPLSITVDCQDWTLNGSKVAYIDSNGHFNIQTLNLPGTTTNSILYGNSTSAVGQVTPPAGPGIFTVGYAPTTSTPIAPATFQVGVCPGGGPITGSTNSYTVAYTDVGCTIYHSQTASASVSVVLATAITLNNTNFGFRYCNQSTHADTITPTTWTIQVGDTAAAATAPVAAGTCILILNDQSGGNWIASGGVSGGTGNTTSTSLTTNALPKANGANSIVNSLFTDTGSLGQYAGIFGLASTYGFYAGAGTGSQAGDYAMVGGSSTPSLAANSVTLLGPPSTTLTSYGLQFPTTSPTNGQTIVFGTPSGGVIPITYGAGGSGLSGQTTGCLPLAASATTSTSSSSVCDNGTTVSTTEALSALSLATTGGANPGLITFPGNTGTPTIGSNLTGILGPPSATFTSYVLELPATGPTTSLPILSCPTPSANISACSFVAAGSTPSLDQVLNLAASKTFADGNFTLAHNAATTTNSQTAIAFGETTAATGTSDVEVGISTAAGSTAIPLQVTQGAAASAAAAPNLASLTGGAGGAAGSSTSAGNAGAAFSVSLGAGSAGGSTSGTGGGGGSFTFNGGTGGNATSGSTTGAGGGLLFLLGSAGTGGILGAGGNLDVQAGTGAQSLVRLKNSSGTMQDQFLLSTGALQDYIGGSATAGQGAHVSRSNNVTPVTVAANVTTAQNLQSFSVVTAAMNTIGYGLHVTGYGFYSLGTNTPTLTFAVNLGSLTLCTWTTGVTTISAANAPFQFTCDAVTTTAGTSGVLEAHGTLSIDLGATNLIGETVYGDTNTSTVGTVSLGTSQTLQVTVTSSLGSTSNSFTERALYVSQF